MERDFLGWVRAPVLAPARPLRGACRRTVERVFSAVSGQNGRRTAVRGACSTVRGACRRTVERVRPLVERVRRFVERAADSWPVGLPLLLVVEPAEGRGRTFRTGFRQRTFRPFSGRPDFAKGLFGRFRDSPPPGSTPKFDSSLQGACHRVTLLALD